MFEQDYIIRLIKEMVRMFLKLLFNIDTDTPTAELITDKEVKSVLDELGILQIPVRYALYKYH